MATPAVFAALAHRLAAHERRLRESFLRLERLREEFAAVVAHDLRNPIHSIRIQTEYLLARVVDGQVTVPAEMMEGIHRGAERLSRMVSDLLDASRIEASRLDVAPAPVDLFEAARALVERMKPTLRGHPVEVLVEGTPPAVRADPVRLDQVLTNLIENAARYSGPDAPITVAVRGEPGGATVRVQDRGPGIPAEELPTLFDRFRPGRRTGQAGKQGLGLGLYIVKGLVDAHGGRLRVDTSPGAGSTFSVWLPAAA